VALKGSSAGLRAEWFEMKSLKKLPSDAAFHGATPVLVNTVPNLDYASTEKEFATSGMKADFAAQFEGFIDIEEAGEWTFFLESDDGSSLFVDGVEVVDNDGEHGMEVKSGSKTLTAGQHEIGVDFFQNGGGAGLILSWKGPGVPKETPIPSSAFRCNPQAGAEDR